MLRDNCWFVIVGTLRAVFEHITNDYTKTEEGSAVAREQFFGESFSSSWTDRAAKALQPIISATADIPTSLCLG